MDSLKSARIKALHAGVVLASALLVATDAVAVELGEITLSSALNEPLQATIELNRLEGADASSLTFTIADQAAYEAVDVERDPVLEDVSFTVEVDDQNEGRLILNSTGTVTEPFLNLIVAATDAGGETTMREYTLLLELPNESAVPPAQQAPAVAAPTAEAAPATASNDGADTYEVGAGDTMFDIALATRPDASVSPQQMMVAIQRANPDAFINNNINQVISGRVLRIPSMQEIGVIDQQSAVAQISEQNLGGQPLAVGNTGTGGAAADTRDQLRVLSGDDAVDAGGGSSDLAATIAALENELMLSEESLDRARIENLELNNRMTALQEQIDLLENIIAIEDERIATLQADLAQQAEATQQALATADTAAAALTDIEREPESGLNGLLRNGVVMLGALVVLALLVLGFLFHRRRQAQLAAEDNAFNPAFASDDAVLDHEVEKPGLLAGLLARFRRKDEEEDLDDFDDEELAAQAPAASVVTNVNVANVTPVPVAKKKDSTDNLLDEMGLSEEMLSLDDALDGIERAHAEQAATDTFAPLEDAATAEVRAVNVETAAQSADSDYALTAAAEAFAAIDQDAAEAEAVEFNTTAIAAPVDVPAEVAQEEVAETFEFTLKDLPEVESPAIPATEKVEGFEFKLSTPAPAQAVPAPAAKTEALAAQADEIEVIAFPGASTAKKEEPPQEDDIALDLGDLSFDDTMVTDEGESQYTPRSGNECDTKLDLATAYEAMGDVSEAIEILDEVIAEGSPAQVETAQRLKETWQASL